MIEDTKISNTILSLVEKIKQTYQPDKIILYGSFAYGVPDEDSDIDLLIIKNTSQRPIDRRITIRRLVSDLRRRLAFSSIVVTPGELQQRLKMGDQFFAEIIAKGKVLYAR